MIQSMKENAMGQIFLTIMGFIATTLITSIIIAQMNQPKRFVVAVQTYNLNQIPGTKNNITNTKNIIDDHQISSNDKTQIGLNKDLQNNFRRFLKKDPKNDELQKKVNLNNDQSHETQIIYEKNSISQIINNQQDQDEQLNHLEKSVEKQSLIVDQQIQDKMKIKQKDDQKDKQIETKNQIVQEPRMKEQKSSVSNFLFEEVTIKKNKNNKDEKVSKNEFLNNKKIITEKKEEKKLKQEDKMNFKSSNSSVSLKQLKAQVQEQSSSSSSSKQKEGKDKYETVFSGKIGVKAE